MDAINHTIADCHSRGGGTVWFPSGVYLTGTVELMSNVTLYLDAGSVIQGSSDINHYKKLAYSSEYRETALITAIDTTNIAITGRGVIDGNGDVYMNLDKAEIFRDFVVESTRQGEAAYFLMNDVPNEGRLFVNNDMANAEIAIQPEQHNFTLSGNFTV